MSTPEEHVSTDVTPAESTAPEALPSTGDEVLDQYNALAAQAESERGPEGPETPEGEAPTEPSEPTEPEGPTPERLEQMVNDLRSILGRGGEDQGTWGNAIQMMERDGLNPDAVVDYIESVQSGQVPTTQTAPADTQPIFGQETDAGIMRLFERAVSPMVQRLEQRMEAQETAQARRDLDQEFQTAVKKHPDLTEADWKKIDAVGREHQLNSWEAAAHWYLFDKERAAGVEEGQRQAALAARSRERRTTLPAGAGKPTEPAMDLSKPWDPDVEGVEWARRVERARGRP